MKLMQKVKIGCSKEARREHDIFEEEKFTEEKRERKVGNEKKKTPLLKESKWISVSHRKRKKGRLPLQ